jgi:hypothetical protein
LLGEALRAARRRRPALHEPGHHRAAQEIAVVLETSVRGVLEPAEIPGLRLREDLGAAAAEQRTREPTTAERHPLLNRPQPAHAGAAHDPEQHGFELIVAMMRREQHVAWGQQIRERRVARRARGCFETRARAPLDLDANGDELDAERASRRLAVRAPERRVGMQPVIDVRRAQRRA